MRPADVSLGAAAAPAGGPMAPRLPPLPPGPMAAQQAQQAAWRAAVPAPATWEDEEEMLRQALALSLQDLPS